MHISKFDEDRQDMFIQTYAECGVMSEAARVAGVTRQTAMVQQRHNAKFKKRVVDAREQYIDSLEFIMHKRIKDGESKMADTLLIFSLKSRRPELYTERFEHKVEANIKVISAVPRPQKLKKTTAKPS